MNFNSTEKYYPLVLGLLAFALFSNTLFHQYCFDDNLVTSLHPLVKEGIEGIPQIFSSNYTVGIEKSFEYRPFTRATFALEYELFGENLFINHLVNVLLYSLTCALLYLLTISLFGSRGRWFAIIAILLFTVHPTHSEVVSSLKNREELFSFVFCLASVLFFIRYLKESKLTLFALGSVLYGLALFTKLTCLPFILIIPLCMYYAGAKSFKEPLYAFVSLLLLTVVFVLSTKSLLPGTYDREIYYIENPIVIESSFSVLILNGFQTMWTYIKLYVWPQPMSFYNGFDVFPVPKNVTVEIVLSFLLHGFMAGYALFKINKRDVAAFAILFYLLNMSMYYNLAYPVPGILSDRAMFVASFGFSILISSWLTHLSSPKKALICIALILPASLKTYSRNNKWKDNSTLLGQDIGHLSSSVKANIVYASHLKSQWEKETNGRKKTDLAQKSIRFFTQSLKVKSDMANPYNEIGEIIFNQYAEYGEALKYFQKAIEMMDSKAEFHFNLATNYVVLGEYGKAEASFLTTIQLEPGFTKAIHNLFLVYMRQEKYEQAFRINSSLMEKTPEDVYPYFNFGKYYIATEDSLNAKLYFEKADALSPGNSEIISILKSLDTIL